MLFRQAIDSEAIKEVFSWAVDCQITTFEPLIIGFDAQTAKRQAIKDALSNLS
jgi:hypothetical protein